MTRILIPALTVVTLMAPVGMTYAQTAGTTQLGVTVVQMQDVVKGWSAKRQILGQPVYNEKGEEVGRVEDIIISPEKTASYAIVGAGGFLGIGTHDVAIPANQLKLTDNRLVLAGATKESLRNMPQFEYTRK